MEITNIEELEDRIRSNEFDFANCQVISSKIPPRDLNEEFVLGVDEAGRGPVLGPMVYAVSYVKKGRITDLEDIGCADSKTLTEAKREDLFSVLCACDDYLGWVVNAISPNFISNKMLQRSKYSLNEIAENATVQLIRNLLDNGINITEIYVDTVGPPEKYEEKLSKEFPGRKVTVAKKADSIYPIVSAASICAKVIRDTVIRNWKFSEDVQLEQYQLGSGYPNDPQTKKFLKNYADCIFGYPNVVRFSWSTASKALEDPAVVAPVEWLVSDWIHSVDDNQKRKKLRREDEEDSSPTRSITAFFKPKSNNKKMEMKHVFFKQNNLTNITSF